MKAKSLLLLILLCKIISPLQASTNKCVEFHEIDILNYNIFIKLDDKNESVTGTTTIKFLAPNSNVSKICLDAVDFQIYSIRILPEKYSVIYDYDSTQISCKVLPEISVKDTCELQIDYYTEPLAGIYFYYPAPGDSFSIPQIYSDNEPQNARFWFPCFDHPSDKASSDIQVVVRDDYKIISNGQLISFENLLSEHKVRYHWQQKQPHATYLMSFAAGSYREIKQKNNDRKISYYAYPGTETLACKILRNTNSIINHFESRFSVFPWEKYSQIFVSEFKALGMENTSITFLNDRILKDVMENPSQDYGMLIGHEIAHQWFGNLVTCEDWSDIWLNESFATYAEYLLLEATKGKEAADYHLYLDKETYLQFRASENDLPIYVTTYNDPWSLFNPVTYNKGAWVLHMLRNLLGDTLFFSTLKNYLAKFAFENVSTTEFINFWSNQAGQNLGWYFEQWLFSTGIPHFNIQQNWNSNSGILSLNITQKNWTDCKTDRDLYQVPIQIGITTQDTVFSKPVFIKEKKQVIEFSLNSAPLSVRFNENYTILCMVYFPKSTQELVYQLENDVCIIGRIQALEELEKIEFDDFTLKAVAKALSKDSFWAIRKQAASLLSGIKEPEAISSLLAGLRDEDYRVRTTCLEALADSIDNCEFASSLFYLLENDSNTIVLKSVLGKIANLNSKNVSEKLNRFLARNTHLPLIRKALLALAKSGRPGDTNTWIRYLQPEYPLYVRYAAFNNLENLDSCTPELEQILLDALVDPDRGIVRRAINSLTILGCKSALPMLKTFLSGIQDNQLKNRIEEAIKTLTD